MQARVTLACGDAAVARAVARATAVDNPKGLLTQRVEGTRITVEAGPSAVGSLRATLDDWLRCATAALEAARRAR